MPKSIDVTPARLGSSDFLPMPKFPVFSYQRTIVDEQQSRSDEALRNVLRHMLIIREFEEV